MRIRRFCPAKLNLFLHIVGRRADGYHELQSVFQRIDFGDVLTFTLADQFSLTGHFFDCTIENNLIFRALKLIHQHFPHTQQQHVHVHIQKNIPSGAGLGGGSSNAATTLLALNTLFELNLAQHHLMQLGLLLGADVPIFIMQQSTCWVEGIGEHITPIQTPPYEYILLLPEAHMETRTLFNAPDLERNCPRQLPFQCMPTDYLDNGKTYNNVFQPIAYQRAQPIQQAIDYLNQFGIARLTGTGAAVFLPFNPQNTHVNHLNIIHNAPCAALHVKPYHD